MRTKNAEVESHIYGCNQRGYWDTAFVWFDVLSMEILLKKFVSISIGRVQRSRVLKYFNLI